MLPAVRYFDLIVLALALPVFLLGGLPITGWGAGAGAWAAQRGLQEYLDSRARSSDDPRTVVGLLAGSMIARGWLVAIVVFLVGLSDRRAGLAGAVLVVVLFTIYFTVRMIMRPFDAPPHGTAGGASSTGIASAGISSAGISSAGASAGGASPTGEGLAR